MHLDEFINRSIDQLKSNFGERCFYDRAVDSLYKWAEDLKKVDSIELSDCVRHQLSNVNSTRSFNNLINKIIKQYLQILKYTYQGNVFEAIVALRKLLFNKTYTENKLTDLYYNYFTFSQILTHQKFYRIVSFDKNVTPINCNHVPFDKRNSAKHNRFNTFGFPALYLSDSIEGCKYELDYCSDQNNMYYSEFTHSITSYYFNLTIPSQSLKANYDKFCFIITYPMLFLCLAHTKGSNQFEEEYLFSQLLFPTLFLSSPTSALPPSYLGIAYNSTKDYNTLNLVIPAKLEKDEIYPKNIISKYISSTLIENGPFSLNR